MLAKQAEFANKALDITVQNARDVSELASRSIQKRSGLSGSGFEKAGTRFAE
jgi:hypothetical protein